MTDSPAIAAIIAEFEELDQQGWINDDTVVGLIRRAAAAAREEAILAERERCAKVADAYAEENITMSGDSVLHDPLLHGGPWTPENIKKSEGLTIDGTIHSAMFHAAQNIAAAIRAGK